MYKSIRQAGIVDVRLGGVWCWHQGAELGNDNRLGDGGGEPWLVLNHVTNHRSQINSRYKSVPPTCYHGCWWWETLAAFSIPVNWANGVLHQLFSALVINP